MEVNRHTWWLIAAVECVGKIRQHAHDSAWSRDGQAVVTAWSLHTVHVRRSEGAARCVLCVTATRACCTLDHRGEHSMPMFGEHALALAT
jgi:hypothetical protein